jgi:CMP-N-acetylneuraminic acid synthetase
MNYRDFMFIIPAQIGGTDRYRDPLDKFGSDDQTLLDIKIKQLLNFVAKDQIMVSSYHQDVLKVAEKYCVHTHKRKASYQEEKNKSFGEVLSEVTSNINSKFIAWVSPVHPFFETENLQEAVHMFNSNYSEGTNDSLFSALEVPGYFLDPNYSPVNFSLNSNLPKRGDCLNCHVLTGALYIGAKSTIDKVSFFSNGSPFYYKTGILQSFDIDAKSTLLEAKDILSGIEKAKSDTIKEVVLDFDGVLFDSVAEAYFVALMSENPDLQLSDVSFDTTHYKDFLELRYKIGPAWNYYYVLKAISDKLKNKNIVIPEQPSVKARMFEGAFFATRSILRKLKPELWESLSKPYSSFDQFAELINKNKNISILTTKDFYTVQSLLKKHGVHRKVDIYDRETYEKYGSKQEYLVHHKKINSLDKIYFLDDNKKHLDHLSQIPGFTARQASWGYVSSEDKFDNSSEVLSELKEFLE